MRRVALALGLLLVLIGFSSAAVAEQTVRFNDSPNQITLLDQDQSGVTFRLNVGQVDFVPVATREGDFTLLVAKGFTRSQDLGNPNVPLANRLIAIPMGCQLSAEVVSSQVQELYLSDYGVATPLMPVQPSLSKSDDPADVPFEYNLSTYSRAGYYQLPAVSTGIEGIMRGVRVGNVSLSPVQYNPVENKVIVNTEMVVRVSFDNADWNETQRLFEKTYSIAFEPVYQRLANYDGMFLQTREDLTRRPLRMLVVSDRMFEAQLQPLLEWKTEKGILIDTAYTDVIGATTTAIHNHIESIYGDTLSGKPAPSFVLFVGDTPQIPSYSGSAGSHITDMRYCEFTDDDIPEIYFGRFSAQNSAQLQPQIDKTLEYELYTMPDPTYLQEVTLIAGVDASHAPTYGNGQINYGTNNYFNLAHGIIDHTWLYPASDDPGASAAIIQTVQDGVGLINYTAHCSHSGFADPSFTVSNINSLSNAHMYPLGIGNCCLSSTFGESTPCFGEAWLQKVEGGGVAYIGGTNSTLWDEDYWWGVGNKPLVGDGPPYDPDHIGAYDGLFHDHGEPLTQHYVTNYAIAMCGNLAVQEAGSSYTEYYWEIYCLLGDPSVMTYLGQPIANTISHDATMLLSATSFTIEADPGSYVGISYDGVLHGAGYVDETGIVDVEIEPFGTPVQAEIVVTAQNRVPYMTTVQVISPDGPYVIHDEHAIDDAAGNSNGLVDFGESIVLGVQLINVGPATAQDVQATLSSLDIYADITDNTEYYGTIEGDFGISYIADAFAFDVDPATPDGHRINFILTVTGQERDTMWTSEFSVTSHAPDLGYVSVVVDDASGDGNGIFDPGETVDLTVTLENGGSGHAYNVAATLSEADEYVNVIDDSGAYGNILSGNSADNSGDIFTVEADSTCPMGHYLTCSLEITSDGGYSTTVDFNLTVGHKVAFFTEDFSLEQGWTGLGSTSEWEIGAAQGLGGDPSDDHTPGSDNYVLGNDLSDDGEYSSGIDSTNWAVSPELDCSEITEVVMTYYHKLGVESSSYDHAYLEAYDGIDWVTLYHNGSTINESDWTEDVYDLSEIADNNPFFKIRFGLGPTDNGVEYCGWNIDDIEFKGYVSGLAGTAAMEFVPGEISDSLVEGETALHTISVTNTGEATLRVRLLPQQSWIQCSSDLLFIESGNYVDVPVTLVSDGMTPGANVGSLNYTSNDGSSPTGSVPVDLYIYEPQMGVDPAVIVHSVPSAGQDTLPFLINNTGPGRLSYSIVAQTDDKAFAKQAVDVFDVEPLGYRVADPDKTGVQEAYYPEVTKGSGGPDTFGYTWIDSDEAGGPAFDWIDISSVGTEVTLTDDNFVGPMSLGFTFPFYDSSYTSLAIASNGLLCFGDGASPVTNAAIPSTADPDNFIAMWWDDLDPPENGHVYYYSDMTNNRFIVSFVDIRNYMSPSGTGSLTFQAILSSNGLIKMQYLTMDPGTDSDGLTGATIGIESPEDLQGVSGLQVVHNAAYMHDQLAILFLGAAPLWMTTSPSGGFVEPFSQAAVDVIFNASEIEDGEYTGQLVVSSNDQINPVVQVPVTLNVGEVPLPQIPALLTPEPDEIMDYNTPEFTWSATAGYGGTYTLECSQDVGFQTGVETHADLTETSFTPESGMADGVWYWHVQAHNQAGASGYQPEPASFTIETYITGDANGDDLVNISDAVALIEYIFAGGPAPDPMECGDCNCDLIVNISDATYLIAYIFAGGPAPCVH